MIIKTIYENARRKSRKDSRNRTEKDRVSSAFSGREENLETRKILVRGIGYETEGWKVQRRDGRR